METRKQGQRGAAGRDWIMRRTIFVNDSHPGTGGDILLMWCKDDYYAVEDESAAGPIRGHIKQSWLELTRKR